MEECEPVYDLLEFTTRIKTSILTAFLAEFLRNPALEWKRPLNRKIVQHKLQHHAACDYLFM